MCPPHSGEVQGLHVGSALGQRETRKHKVVLCIQRTERKGEPPSWVCVLCGISPGTYYLPLGRKGTDFLCFVQIATNISEGISAKISPKQTIQEFFKESFWAAKRWSYPDPPQHYANESLLLGSLFFSKCFLDHSLS